MNITHETISPSLAQTYISHAPAPKRDEAAIERYAQTMAAGQWLLNAQPILFDTEGNLIDGVQRLFACIKANVPFRTAIARNVRADTVHTIDRHKRRTYRGVLDSRGYKHAGTVLNTLSKLIRIDNGALGKPAVNVSWSRYDKVLACNPDIATAIDLARSAGSANALHMNVRCALAVMASKAGHRAEITAFFHALNPTQDTSPNSSLQIFRVQLLTWKEAQLSMNVDKVLGHALLYFNAVLNAEHISAPLSWQPQPTDPWNMGLPEMVGYPGLAGAKIDTAIAIDDIVSSAAQTVPSAPSFPATSADPTIRTTFVTPDMAARWLGRDINRGNRQIQPRNIETIARDIDHGRWMVNAQPISFTGNPFHIDENHPPRLLNGQHRLKAIELTGTSIELPIAWGIPEAAFETYDVQRRRNLFDSQNTETGDMRVFSAAARLQFKEDNGLPLDQRTIAASPSDMLEILHRHPGLKQAYSLARAPNIAHYASTAVLCYFIYRVRREAPELADTFFDGMETGANLGAGNPILKMRNELHGPRIGNNGRTRQDSLRRLMHYWNAYKAWSASNEAPQT